MTNTPTKKLIITEKPSVARDFARVLGVDGKRRGYIENEEYIITWCVGHLVEMVYPEKYDPKYKTWKLEDLPFLPDDYKYDIISNVKEQYETVHGFLNSANVDVVYWAGDSGKEGQTIEENIRNYGGVRPGMKELRVWIDSQTDEEIRRGIAQAKPMSEYANLGKSGIMRAIEDYALGINFSRALTVKYASMVNRAAATKKYTAIAVGRVMTCVLGMVVNREREIRNFKETDFYRVIGQFGAPGTDGAVTVLPALIGSDPGASDASAGSRPNDSDASAGSRPNDSDASTGNTPGSEEASRGSGLIRAEWSADEKSAFFKSPLLYKENGFRNEADAKKLIDMVSGKPAVVESLEKTKTKKKPPALFNLAELQAECAKRFKISPDQTLAAAQELYERKLTTYPRTDARVLTTAVAKEIRKNIQGLTGYPEAADFANHILTEESYKGIAKTQYTDDSKVTDHYAIIPTGQTGGVKNLSELHRKVYDLIVRRFLSIFYPPAEYLQMKVQLRVDTELFTCSQKVLTSPGFLEVAGAAKKENEEDDAGSMDAEMLSRLKKGANVGTAGYEIKPGKTTPPKRYTSGTMILAMENAGSLIEDEELRAQIKNTGIGTSATRAEIIKKLITIAYLNLNKKTQVLTPSGIGEMIYEVVNMTVPSLLNPQMSASWEKGLDEITRGSVRVEDYREKLENYIRKETLDIAGRDKSAELADTFEKMIPEDGSISLPKRNLGMACPACGGELTTTPFGYGCSNYNDEKIKCRFSVGKIAGRRLTEEEFRELIENGKTGKLDGFTSKAGRKFSAGLVLERAEGRAPKVSFDFASGGSSAAGFDGTAKTYGASTTGERIDSGRPADAAGSSMEKIICPICGRPVVKTENGFSCEGHQADGSGCIFSIGKIKGKELTEQNIRELITRGYTSPIEGFIDQDGKTFSGCIILSRDEGGKVNGMKFRKMQE